jgi:hypothetical protein
MYANKLLTLLLTCCCVVFACFFLSLLQIWQQKLGDSRISAAPAARLQLAVAGTGNFPASMREVVRADGSEEAAGERPMQEIDAEARAAEGVRGLTGSACQIEVQQQEQVVVCSSDGALDLLHVRAAAVLAAPEEQADCDDGAAGAVDVPQAVTTLAETVLPGELFSSPVYVDQWLLLGCRDDHLYCLKVVKS